MSRYTLLLSVLALAALWALLTHAAPAAWMVGAPFIGLAVAAMWRQHRSDAAQVSMKGLLRFIPFFFRESARGGVDVARRVLGRRLRIRPGFSDYPVRLRSRRARLLFANSVSLLPGTLAADLQGDRLLVHALDAGTPFAQELARIEQIVAGVFGESL